MIRRLSRSLDRLLERSDHRQSLNALGLNAWDIKTLQRAGLDPISGDFTLVSVAAMVGISLDAIPSHVAQVRRVTRELPYLDALDAAGLIERLHVWGIPRDHAATLITRIARATEGAPDEHD